MRRVATVIYQSIISNTSIYFYSLPILRRINNEATIRLNVLIKNGENLDKPVRDVAQNFK